MAATNRPQVLDEAILRPGRVDRVVYVPHPDRDTRFHILKLYCKRMPVADDVDPEMIADKTELFSGADLKNVCREVSNLSTKKSYYSSVILVRVRVHWQIVWLTNRVTAIFP